MPPKDKAGGGKKKGQSLEEKKANLLNWWKKKNTFFDKKELEKHCKSLGVVNQYFKEIIDSLIAEGIVLTDRVGSSTVYWLDSNKEVNDRRNKLDQIERLEKKVAELKITKESSSKYSGNDKSAEQKNDLIIYFESVKASILAKNPDVKDKKLGNMDFSQMPQLLEGGKSEDDLKELFPLKQLLPDITRALGASCQDLDTKLKGINEKIAASELPVPTMEKVGLLIDSVNRWGNNVESIVSWLRQNTAMTMETITSEFRLRAYPDVAWGKEEAVALDEIARNKTAITKTGAATTSKPDGGERMSKPGTALRGQASDAASKKRKIDLNGQQRDLKKRMTAESTAVVKRMSDETAYASPAEDSPGEPDQHSPEEGSEPFPGEPYDAEEFIPIHFPVESIPMDFRELVKNSEPVTRFGLGETGIMNLRQYAKEMKDFVFPEEAKARELQEDSYRALKEMY